MLKLALALLTFVGLGCSAPAHGPAEVIEVVTFRLKPEVTAESFLPLDRAVEAEHVAKQPGFVSRESATGADGEWLVIVHWRSEADADASMASFSAAPATAAFMSKLEPDSLAMKRYRAK